MLSAESGQTQVGNITPPHSGQTSVPIRICSSIRSPQSSHSNTAESSSLIKPNAIPKTYASVPQ